MMCDRGEEIGGWETQLKESEERRLQAETQRDGVRGEMEKMRLEHEKTVSLLKSDLQEVETSDQPLAVYFQGSLYPWV